MAEKVRGLACLTTARWWNAALTRALKTAIQTTIASGLVGAAGEATLVWAFDWVQIGGIALAAALLSLMMSLNGIPEVVEDDVQDGGAHE